MDEMQEPLFTTVKLEDFVPADHPLRPLRLLVNQALKRLNGLFGTIYADSGRASIAPEKLLRALLLQVLYSVRSERMLMEQMRYNLLFRWFVGLAIEDAVWDHSVFSKNHCASRVALCQASLNRRVRKHLTTRMDRRTTGEPCTHVGVRAHGVRARSFRCSAPWVEGSNGVGVTTPHGRGVPGRGAGVPGHSLTSARDLLG